MPNTQQFLVVKRLVSTLKRPVSIINLRRFGGCYCRTWRWFCVQERQCETFIRTERIWETKCLYEWRIMACCLSSDRQYRRWERKQFKTSVSKYAVCLCVQINPAKSNERTICMNRLSLRLAMCYRIKGFEQKASHFVGGPICTAYGH